MEIRKMETQRGRLEFEIVEEFIYWGTLLTNKCVETKKINLRVMKTNKMLIMENRSQNLYNYTEANIFNISIGTGRARVVPSDIYKSLSNVICSLSNISLQLTRRCEFLRFYLTRCLVYPTKYKIIFVTTRHTEEQ